MYKHTGLNRIRLFPSPAEAQLIKCARACWLKAQAFKQTQHHGTLPREPDSHDQLTIPATTYKANRHAITSFIHLRPYYNSRDLSTLDNFDMTQMTQTNSSTTSLHSYRANQDVLPTYSVVVEELEEPERAYIAQQRDAFDNIDAKPPTSRSNNADVESQQRRAPSARELAWREREDREINRDMRREKWTRRAGCGSGSVALTVLLIAAAMICIPVFLDMIEDGTPSIPPPYPSTATWNSCHQKLSTDQTRVIFVTLGVWYAAALSSITLNSWSTLHIRGRKVAIEGTLACVSLLGVCAFFMTKSALTRFCPKEFVEGAL